MVFSLSLPDGQHQNQTDFILCSQRWTTSIQSAKTRPGADCGSDHELFIAKFRLKLKKVWKTIRPSRYAAATAKSLQSCPTLCDPIDVSPPGSPVPEILQARTLEWVAISFSPSRYDLNQIPYDYTVEVRNRFKGLDLIECLKNY